MLLSSLAKFAVSLANLAEAELRAFRGGAMRVCLRAGLVLAGVLLLLGGFAFVLFGVYSFVRQVYSAGAAGLITGFGTIALAVIWIVVVMKLDSGSRR